MTLLRYPASPPPDPCAATADDGRTGSSGTNGTSKNPVAVAQQDTARDAWQKPEVMFS